MNFSDLVTKRQAKQFLTATEIDYIVENYSNGIINDEQMVDLLDAFMNHDMSDQETIDFFDATYKRAQIVNIDNTNAFTIDKSSTGGIGDKTTMILMPILHALGFKVFKLSTVRLAWVGGTIEKLSSFKGMELNIASSSFENKAQKQNTLIANAHDEISIFEKKLYRLRHFSQRVGIVGMIVNSFMIKKMVLQNKGLIINLKIGGGAFIQTMSDALRFINLAMKIATKYGRKATFIISDLNQPLGYAVGNKIEVLETFDYLEGKLFHLNDLNDLIHTHVHEALQMNNQSKDMTETSKLIHDVIRSGAAMKSLRYLVENQNGDFNALYNDRHLQTKHKIEIYSDKKGYFKVSNDTWKIGDLVNEMNLSEEKINYEVGLQLWKKNGDLVQENELIATIWTDHNKPEVIKKRFNQMVIVQDLKFPVNIQIKKIIRNF